MENRNVQILENYEYIIEAKVQINKYFWPCLEKILQYCMSPEYKLDLDNKNHLYFCFSYLLYEISDNLESFKNLDK